MMAARLRRPRRPNMRRAVILFPSGLTLGNLFFGIFAIITASRGDFRMAGVWVLWGGIFDALDGRVARAANAGSQFGEELDSLVDAISFGLAPAMIMYFAVLNRDGWDWIFVFLFAACAVMRLARFNIEQAGTAKTYFRGLPSPAAGCTLASYYWFSQSPLYTYGAIGNLPWQEMLRFLMAALAFLMISNVPYPVFPRTGFRSLRSLAATLLLVSTLVLLATKRLEFFFPLTLVYVAWGLFRWVFSGLFERRQPTIPYDLSEGEDDEDEDDDEEFDAGPSEVVASRAGHRGRSSTGEEIPKKPRPREEVAERSSRDEERPLRAAREETPARAERPQRTKEERLARQERRAKRERREARPERPPRSPRSEAAAAPAAPIATGVTAISVSDGGASAATDNQVIGRIPGAAEPPALPLGADGAGAPRKRKRRRRRGERRERAPGGAETTESGDAQSQDARDGGFDSTDVDIDAASPYSAPRSISPVPQPPLLEPDE